MDVHHVTERGGEDGAQDEPGLLIVIGVTFFACRSATHSRTWLGMISFIRIGPNQATMRLPI